MSRAGAPSARRGWKLLPNPGYTGEPRILEPQCHDRSPFLTIRCTKCHGANHVHETQIAGAPPDALCVLNCAYCRTGMEFPMGFIHGAFQQMRDDGWIR